MLDAGATFVGNFLLPNRAGSEWIYIQGAAASSLPPPGTRIGPADAALMPKIISPNSDPAIATRDGAHHFRLVGLEITVAPGVPTIYSIVAFGGTQADPMQTPHHLILDRSYVHGQPTGDVMRAVLLNSAHTAVIDSHIADAHAVGFDSQAILGYNGPGPFKIVNNYLEGAGENIMFGGADPRVANLVPSDIEIRRNLVAKKTSWNPASPTYAGIPWTIKNLFELKNAQRVLVDGNVFERVWPAAQTGFAIVLTPRNQDGTAPWSVVQDVTFTNNTVRESYSGVNLLGTDNIHPSQQTRRILIRNNLFDGLQRVTFQILDGTDSVTIDHNTGFPPHAVILADGTPHTQFTFTNNISAYGLYGIFGSNYGSGNRAITFYFPDSLFAKNLLIGPDAVNALASYPAGTYGVESPDLVGFLDWPGRNYRLAASSPYRGAATDGKDLGVDFAALDAAQGVPAAGHLLAPTNLTVR